MEPGIGPLVSPSCWPVGIEKVHQYGSSSSGLLVTVAKFKFKLTLFTLWTQTHIGLHRIKLYKQL